MWSDEVTAENTLVFSVIENNAQYQQGLKLFRYKLLAVLLAISFILALSQIVILRLGLRPLRGLTVDVKAMVAGEITCLAGSYPAEIQPLVSNLNLLIENERRLREKYHNRSQDLSHSLKTPIAVLQGLVFDQSSRSVGDEREALIQVISAQVLKLNTIVTYQLDKHSALFSSYLFSSTPVEPELKDILSALQKIYQDKQILLEQKITTHLHFMGDVNDLSEILGNILDNAFKHCVKRVKVTIGAFNERGGLSILVEDDGTGIPESMRNSVLQRAGRLDSTIKGHGIGLAMVVDLVESYSGHIAIGCSDLGGACFKVILDGNK